jgi:predicted polyphosphate/ATP-dependent NAD kinase
MGGDLAGLPAEIKVRLGLIVNPIAGIGGRVGLMGSDSVETQREALKRGAVPQSHLRAAKALEVLLPLKESLELFTAPGAMGDGLTRQLGFSPHVVGRLAGESTSAQDTVKIARAMAQIDVDLILFAGGDGTARDVFTAVGTHVPVLGIPAGVKIHSSVFATHPRVAGEIAVALLRGEKIHLREREVVDLDEGAYREGKVTTRLYGFLNVPSLPHALQNRKAPSLAADSTRLTAISVTLVETMEPGWLYILGPGTTTRAIAEQLGFPKTLVGVDVYTRTEVVALDVSERRLLELLKDQPAKIIITPIGGQGFIFGRGNQQISPLIIRMVGRENIWVVSLVEKLNFLQGEPLLVDTGDPETDSMLTGYWKVITGYREQVVYRVIA